ncbi:MAG: histone deacetylase [Limnobacter sp.]|uniref:histone deacetylase family protein n=1 Tax=Limnobacter sp. TaxID=2003368 RepID=UPI00391C4E78
MIEAFYTDHFVLPLPHGHRFPMQKYRMLRDSLVENLSDIMMMEAPAATFGQLALAHCPRYIDRVMEGTLSPQEQKSIGFPWSPAMAERAKRSVGATIAAVRSAVQYGAAVNLAGGTHHSKRASGAGFCVFNDAIVASRVIQTDVLAQARELSCRLRQPKVLMVDLDVHQGDGSAELAAGDDSLFTLSLHGASNYPFEKAQSDLDVPLPEGTGDQAYLDALNAALAEVEQRFAPDLIIYLAGLDAHEEDRLGKLALTDAGIAARDACVFDWAAHWRVPVVMTMAGGYFKNLDRLVALQTECIQRLVHYSRISRPELSKQFKQRLMS